MCTWIVWISSLSPSKHPRPNHVPIVIVIQSEYLKNSISPRNQSAKHPGCFGISEVVIGPALSKRWRSNRAWKASGIQGRKWLSRDHDVVVFKTKVLHFKIENTPIKDTNGKRNESFSLWNCLSRNSTLFSTRRIGALGLFWTNQGSEVSEDTWGTFRTLWSKKSAFLKRNFCIYKGFMDVFYILTSAWKKNHKMCIWNWFF